MSIKWLERIFEGPFPIKYWEPVRKGALFAVMVKPNPMQKPTSFRILFFGQAGRILDSGYFSRHRKSQCWINFAGEFERLFVAFHAMPDSDSEEREQAVAELIERYKPVCNF